MFLAGLALNLTPCIYPVIPITIAYFGGQSSVKNPTKVAMALLYLLGMSITYSILGVVAGLTGMMFGSLLQNPIVLGFIACVLIAMALSMFGFFEITIPQFFLKLGNSEQKGYLGSVIMGLSVGFVAAPCIGPFLLGLLAYIGKTQDPFMGFLLFFTMSIGMGLPMVVLAISTSTLNKMPRSGEWMLWIKKVFGIILIVMALFFIKPLLTEKLYLILNSVLLILAFIFLAFIDKTGNSLRIFRHLKIVISLLLVLITFYLIKPEKIEEKWEVYNEILFTESINSNKPVILDFYADWCIPCRELNKNTLNKPDVLELTINVVKYKIDITDDNSPVVQELKKKFDIKGVPSILFINKEGKEIPGSRINEFVDSEKFIEHIKNFGVLN